MNLTTIEIKGSSNIGAIQHLLRENCTWHLPFKCITDSNIYEITLKANDPMVSFLQLRYGNRERA